MKALNDRKKRVIEDILLLAADVFKGKSKHWRRLSLL